MLYQYRNLPCTVGKWYVAGIDNQNGKGILEWCYNQSDAENRMIIMQKYPQFSDLMIGEWYESD